MDAPSPRDQGAFYGEVLGLEVVNETSDEVALQAGGTRIRFRRAPPGTTPTYHFERSELLREDGQNEFDWDFWGALAVYTADPAGNVVELIAFSGLSPVAAGDFGAASILGVAELGLPAADVRVAVAELRNTFGLDLWDREEITPERITPVGERGATFLVVPVGRIWHLGDAATDHPLEVTLGGVEEASLELPGHPYSIRGAS
jgi:hypothetical protein